MSDELQFEITVLFPEWEDQPMPELGQTEPIKYPAYALKYLFITNPMAYPEWPEDDPRWVTYDERAEVWKRFLLWARKHIKAEFTGQMLFIEPVQYVFANGKGTVL